MKFAKEKSTINNNPVAEILVPVQSNCKILTRFHYFLNMFVLKNEGL